MPTSVRVGVTLLALLAVLLLLNAALTWFGQDTIIARVVEAQGVSRDDAALSVRTNLLAYLAVGIAATLSALFLARRRPWARWLGLSAAVLLALMSLLSIVSAGGLPPVTLLVLLISVGTVTSLMSGTTREWLPATRRRR
jgi:hypothetical protein